MKTCLTEGRETGKDLVCFKSEYPVRVKCEVKDGERGQAMITVRTVDFILSALKSSLLVPSHLSGLFILVCLRTLSRTSLGPNVAHRHGFK